MEIQITTISQPRNECWEIEMKLSPSPSLPLSSLSFSPSLFLYFRLLLSPFFMRSVPLFLFFDIVPFCLSSLLRLLILRYFLSVLFLNFYLVYFAFALFPFPLFVFIFLHLSLFNVFLFYSLFQSAPSFA